jgi:alanyl aminopeptidase
MRIQTRLLAALAALHLGCGAGTTAEPLSPGQNPGTAPGQQAEAPTTAPAKPAPTPPALRLPDHVTPKAYLVNLTLDPSKGEFTGDARIDVELAKPVDHIWLNATDLSITEARLKSETETVDLTAIPEESDQFAGFTAPRELAPGRYWLELTYTGKVSEKDYTGLFRQEDGGNWYLYSQGEALGARRIFPSFDEPRWKIPFTVSLTVPEAHQALSNTPVKRTMPAQGKDGWKTVVFETTKPLPTYLFAVAVGPFEIVDVGTAGRNKTPVRLVVPKGKTDKLGVAKTSVIELQEKLEAYFDMAYPYRKMDHIIVPHFLGAMENPGLITYDSGIMLAEPGKESWGFLRGHANVVAHELAHQWFGDLVTMPWWNDIWLNESFATWLAGKVVMQWRPKWQGEIQAVAGKNGVMSSDSLISARKIRQPIEDFGDIAAAFDGITYGKGAAVLWMFEQAVGEDKFRQGVRNYIRKHSWGNATAADFLAAIAEVSRPVIPDAFRTFLDQPGVPVVNARLQCEKSKPTAVELTQERYLPTGSKGSSDQTWKIPVCMKWDQQGKVAEACTMLTEKRDEVALPATPKCPRWIMINADGAGYYRASYPRKLLDELIARGSKKLTAAERISVIGDLNALVSAGKLGVGDALAQLPRLLKDKDPFVVESALGIVGQLNDHMVPDKMRPNLARFIRKTFGPHARKLGWTANKGDDDQTKKLRSRLLPLVAVKGEDKRLMAQATKMAWRWLKTGKGIETEDIAEVLGTAAAGGGAKLRDAILAKLKETEDRRLRRSLVTALGSFREPKLVEANLQMFLDDKDLGMRESFGLLGGAMQEPKNRKMAYAWVKKNREAIMEKLPKMARGYIVFVGQAFCDKAHYDDVKSYFGPIVEKELQGKKLLAQTLEGIELCMAFAKAQRPAVEAFLKKY